MSWPFLPSCRIGIKVNDPPAGRSSCPEWRSIDTHGSVELGHDDGVVCGPAETADPPFGGSEAGRLEDERLGFRVVRRGGLETLDIRAVACTRTQRQSQESAHAAGL